MPMKSGTLLPDLSGATEWINGSVEADALHDAPALIYFWAVSCHICHENMPKLATWRETYGHRGLRMVAVHMPRQQADTDVDRVRQMVEELHITDPCAVDNLHAIANAFDNKFVPAYFLFDENGKLCGRSAGDAGLVFVEQTLKRLFAK